MSRITSAERLRIHAVIERAHRVGFAPEPAEGVAARLRASSMAAASSAIEGSVETPLEREMAEQLIRRRVPADLMVKLLLDDLLEHAGADAA